MDFLLYKIQLTVVLSLADAGNSAIPFPVLSELALCTGSLRILCEQTLVDPLRRLTFLHSPLGLPEMKKYGVCALPQVIVLNDKSLSKSTLSSISDLVQAESVNS